MVTLFQVLVTPEIDYLVRSNLGRQDAAGHADDRQYVRGVFSLRSSYKEKSILGGEEV